MTSETTCSVFQANKVQSANTAQSLGSELGSSQASRKGLVHIDREQGVLSGHDAKSMRRLQLARAMVFRLLALNVFLMPVPVFRRKVRARIQDRLRATITDSDDPQHPRFCPSSGRISLFQSRSPPRGRHKPRRASASGSG